MDDRLIGSTLVAAAVTAAVLILARPADLTPPAPRRPPAAPSLSPTDRLALDTQDCLKTTQNEQLHAVFSDLKDAIALIDTLDARCHAALTPTTPASPPTG